MHSKELKKFFVSVLVVGVFLPSLVLAAKTISGSVPDAAPLQPLQQGIQANISNNIQASSSDTVPDMTNSDTNNQSSAVVHNAPNASQSPISGHHGSIWIVLGIMILVGVIFVILFKYGSV